MKRRDFIKASIATAGATLIPLKALAEWEDKEKVDVESSQAQGLEYVEESPVEGEYCRNCVHAKGDLEKGWVGCNLFPNKAVSADGWCNVWSARG